MNGPASPYFVVSWRDWIRAHGTVGLKPWQVRLAPLHHLYMILFKRYRAVDITKMADYSIPRTTPPRCPRCFAPLGACPHDLDQPEKDFTQ